MQTPTSPVLNSRVMFVCTQTEAGGVQIRATGMLRALRAEGVEAKLVFLYKKREIFTDDDGVEVLASKPNGIMNGIFIVLALWKTMKNFRPTAVVGFAHYSSPLAAFLGWITGAKIRIGTQPGLIKKHNFVARFTDWLCGVTGIYTSNICTSNFIREQFSDYPAAYKANLTTVYNGVPLSISDLTKAEARKRFGLPEAGFFILNCGRLSFQKNQKFLLEVLERIPDANLAILGEGELRQDLEREIIERGLIGRVHLLGELHPSEVMNFLSAGDLFAFPSRWEAFGLAVVEAMNAGLPVISSDHAVLTEVVADGGILLPTSDSELWAEQISRLRAAPDKLMRLGVAGQQRSQQFSFAAMLASFKRELNVDLRDPTLGPNHTSIKKNYHA